VIEIVGYKRKEKLVKKDLKETLATKLGRSRANTASCINMSLAVRISAMKISEKRFRFNIFSTKW
jgi:hypothetical protein